MSEYFPTPGLPENPHRGKLKIFLGYAAGVGKTYQMLMEASGLKAQGVDIVIGYFEPHGRRDTIAKTEGLEIIPRRTYEHRGTVFEDMDTEAILLRHPRACVVDEFAHTNIPGSPREKRWEDVAALRNAGIDILTSLNIQHIESLNDQIWHVTGIRVRETVPDWVVEEADELALVDLTPRALLHRLERGVIYSPEKAQRALENFFTESNLTALREIALRQTAHEVEERREEGQPRAGVRDWADSSAAENERILLWLTAEPTTAMLIRRGRRVSDFLHAQCIAVAVLRADEGAEERAARERHLNFARNMQIVTETIEAPDPAQAIADYARREGITQIFVTRKAPQIQKLVRLVRDIQITIVAERVR